ncbi:hypothetical protein [Insolitispirillum peregrinum]|uniref:Uncharacterized protein n=1 Tax=Insolitispirillum peregrinum TaxID=80876 RepID=A0A1N7L6I3_9PROT|nr:hypothetical protein [Insolitispirillum peregrinum]SIS69448.1 hypothetical protein SAMN05421779_103142 [Insolitispirillum peregrinum]
MIRLDGVTRRQHTLALFDVTSAISDAGGWISNHQLYSNMLAMIAFEVPAQNLPALIEALHQAGIVIHDPPELHGQGSEDVAARLTISFLHNDPDLRRPVPAFG